MKKNLNLTMIATLVLVALGSQVANAVESLSAKEGNIKLSQADEFKVFINDQQRSLYQIALLSDISISELRSINKGKFDKFDIVKVGESIVLPSSSPLLPSQANKSKVKDNHSSLPSLGSSDTVGVKADNSVETQVATVLQTLGQQDWDNMSSKKVKNDLSNKTQDYATNFARQKLNNIVVDPIRTAAQDFLGRFGTAQLQFDVSDQAKVNNLNVKLFSPWYDSEDSIIFSQFTYQEFEQKRRIGNFGIGQRWDVADKSWLLGYNVFFDHDFSRNHNRLGLGLEAWTDYMKFAANYYSPLSDWKDSKDFDQYLERAARGYDVRFQGYLPSYPHLGGSLMFEQYFGDKVALFGKDNLQKDPYAVTVGVDYTPVPLFTIKGEHKQGQDAKKMAKVQLSMNYRLGVPLKDQLDPNMVDVARSLKGSRYDLVDRNNYIVLEYKEKKFSVDLASLGFVEEKSIVNLGIAVHNAKDGIKISPTSWNNITGKADLLALSAEGADGDLCFERVGTTACSTNNVWDKVDAKDTNNWSILVPSYINSVTGERNPIASSGVAVPGRYNFDVTLTDGKGNQAVSNQSWLAIKPSSNRRVLLTNVTPNRSGGALPLGSAQYPVAANGTSSIFLQTNVVSNASTTVNTAASLPIPTGQVAGFSDYVSFSEYPIAVAAAPLAQGSEYKSDLPSADEIEKINTIYTASAGGNKVTFVTDNNQHECPTTAPKCLLVKSIRKVVGSASISDDYLIEFATSASLGSVTFTTNFSSYSASSPVTVYIEGGKASKVSVLREGTVVGTINDDGTIMIDGDLVTGDIYTAKVEDGSGLDITNSSDIIWSLVGDNAKACKNDNTILPGDTTASGDDAARSKLPATLFNVSNKKDYQIRGLLASKPSYASVVDKATSGDGGKATSLNNLKVSSIALHGSNTSHSDSYGACAGDQGFKLRLDVN